jgi:hypothetical protein
MSWLLGYTVVSMAVAFIVIKIFDYLFSGVAGGFTGVARAGLFVITWAAITAQSGMRGVSKTARQLRQGNADATSLLTTLTKDERR